MPRSLSTFATCGVSVKLCAASAGISTIGQRHRLRLDCREKSACARRKWVVPIVSAMPSELSHHPQAIFRHATARQLGKIESAQVVCRPLARIDVREPVALGMHGRGCDPLLDSRGSPALNSVRV